MKVMEREDSEPAFLVDIARIGVDLRETFPYSEMFQDCFDEEHVCITHYPQITPEKQRKFKNINISYIPEQNRHESWIREFK